MKNTSVKTGQAFKALALTLCVGVLPLVLGVVGCTSSTRYQQSTGEYMHDQKLSAHVMKALKADYKYKYDGVNVATFKNLVQLTALLPCRSRRTGPENSPTKSKA